MSLKEVVISYLISCCLLLFGDQALHYDVRRGPHSVGSHVRDAAAYVCWAFVRAYSSTIMNPHFEVLAPALLTTACYDREVFLYLWNLSSSLFATCLLLL